MIFFNCSMPRAGSELMQQLLYQNPSIYASRTDGVLELLYAARGNFSTLPEFSSQSAHTMRNAFQSFCKGGLTGWAQSLKGEREHCCLKSRGIMNWLEWFDQFMETEAKVICMVRDLTCIVASMENRYRIERFHHPSVDRPEDNLGATVPDRVAQYMSNVPISMALARLQGVFQRGLQHRICFVKYEDLCRNPQEQMDRVYEYLDLPGQIRYNVDVGNLPELPYEHPGAYGFFGDHSTHSILSPSRLDARQVLGRPICDQIVANNRWYFEELNY